MEQIFEKIKEKQANFSKGFKKVANYFYSDPHVFAMHSATRAGKLIGVSETTIIRFANELGYAGYSALQEEVRQQIFNKSSLSLYIDSKTMEETDNHPMKNLMFRELQMMQQMIQQIQDEDLGKAVEMLTKADAILTCGVRTSYSFANWFAFALDLVRGNARLFQSNIDDILLRVNELTEQSVVVVFSFHRYAVDTINIAKFVKNQGIYVIAFTDSAFAPITKYADVVLPVQLQVKSTLDVAPMVYLLMNTIISTMSLQDKESFQKRSDLINLIEAEDLFAKAFSKGE